MFGPILAMLLCAAPAAPEPVLDPAKVQDLQKFTQLMRPELPVRATARLARIALHVGLRQDVDPYLLLAIARIESNLESGTLACWPKRNGAEGEMTCDHGLGQINDVWVATWKLDKLRLVNDDYYNLWVAARLLVKLRSEFGGEEQNWYGRYHSNVPWRRNLWEKKLHVYYSPPPPKPPNLPEDPASR